MPQYQIQQGDTLSQIAQRKGTTVAKLREENPGVDPRALRVGQTLNLPYDGQQSGQGATQGQAPSSSSAPRTRRGRGRPQAQGQGGGLGDMLEQVGEAMGLSGGDSSGSRQPQGSKWVSRRGDPYEYRRTADGTYQSRRDGETGQISGDSLPTSLKNKMQTNPQAAKTASIGGGLGTMLSKIEAGLDVAGRNLRFVMGDTSTMTEENLEQDERAYLRRMANDQLEKGNTQVNLAGKNLDPQTPQESQSAAASTGMSLGNVQIRRGEDGSPQIRDTFDYNYTPTESKRQGIEALLDGDLTQAFIHGAEAYANTARPITSYLTTGGNPQSLPGNAGRSVRIDL